MLFATSPTRKTQRGKSDAKDIAKMPTVRRKSKIFRAYNKTIEPSDQIYDSKMFTESKKGRFMGELAQHRERSLMMTSLLQSSIDMVSDWAELNETQGHRSKLLCDSEFRRVYCVLDQPPD